MLRKRQDYLARLGVLNDTLSKLNCLNYFLPTLRNDEVIFTQIVCHLRCSDGLNYIYCLRLFLPNAKYQYQ